jgi:hypothetical protein
MDCQGTVNVENTTVNATIQIDGPSVEEKKVISKPEGHVQAPKKDEEFLKLMAEMNINENFDKAPKKIQPQTSYFILFYII